MTIGIKLGQITDEIGSSEFLHCFFSTIAVNLEPTGWGSRFPAIMKGLYSGKLPSSDAEAALIELRSIKSELSKISPKNVVWSYEDRDRLPPWGSDISKDITSLENYFVTSSGRELIPLLEEVLTEASEQNNGNCNVEIVRY